MSSENEDDPQVYESSGSEWNSDDDEKPARKGGRRATRSAKKQRRQKSESSSESEEEEEDEDEDDDEEKPKKGKGRKKNGVSNKKQKVDSDSSTPDTTRTKNINSKDFSTGSFLILKKDAQKGDPKKRPCIWRVDGKALLQKYEPFEDEGTVRHKTTSIYTGWSALDRDLYAPVSVTVKQHNNHTLIVDLDWEKLKEINADSDDE